MKVLLILLPFAMVVLGLLLWLLRRRPNLNAGRASLENAAEKVLATHYRYFPQVRQALSPADTRYLLRRLPPRIAKRVLRERRAVARKFLAGLHQDFSNLERLARMVAALSPVVSREQEFERILLGMRFRVLYLWTWTRLSTGSVSLEPIERLAVLIGQFATRMERAMAAVAAVSKEEGLSAGLSA
jgi:hypothetical protein